MDEFELKDLEKSVLSEITDWGTILPKEVAYEIARLMLRVDELEKRLAEIEAR